MSYELTSFLSKATYPERTADAIVDLFSRSRHRREVAYQIAAAAFAIYESTPLKIIYLDMAIKYIRNSIAGLVDVEVERVGNYTMYLYLRYRQLRRPEDLDAAINVMLLCTSQMSARDLPYTQWLSNLAGYLCLRYDRTNSLKDLEAAITHGQAALNITPPTNPLRGLRLRNLSDYYIRKYQRDSDPEDLEIAIVRGEEALQAEPHYDSNNGELRQKLSLCWKERFDHSGVLKHLEMAIAHAEANPDPSSRMISLASYCCERFSRTKSGEDLETAIVHTNAAAEATPEAPKRARLLRTLARLMHKKYKRTQVLDDLLMAINHAEEALETSPEGLDRALQFYNLGSFMNLKYQHTAKTEDLDRAMQFTERALEATPEGPVRAASLHGLSICMDSKYDRTGNPQYLEKAIAQAEEAVKVTSIDCSGHAALLCNYAEYLSSRYERTGHSKGLDAALSHAEAVVATIEGGPKRAAHLNSLAIALSTKYKRTGNLLDLEKGILLAKESSEATPVDHGDRADRLANFVTILSLRYERTGDLRDLETAIRYSEGAVASTHDSLKRAALLDKLAVHIAQKYGRTGHLVHLEEAITLAAEAERATPVGHPNRGTVLCNIANHLITRYEATGRQQDLDAALVQAQEAMEATPEGHPDVAILLNSHAIIRDAMYERTGNSEDLNMAILRAQAALDATPDSHVDQVRRLGNLGVLVGTRFTRTGNIEDLDMSIALAEQVMEAASAEDSFRRSTQCNNLSTQLFCRYQHTGNLQDLDTAITLINDTVEAVPWPHKHAERAALLANLGVYLSARFERTGNLLDLRMAIAHDKAALTATPVFHVLRANRLQNLSTRMGCMYDQTGDLHDLESAIALGREALEHSHDRTGSFVVLSAHMNREYTRTGDLKHLQAAIAYAEAAVDATPEDHPDQALWFSNLGGYHRTYAENAKETLDATQHYHSSISAYLASWNCKNSPLLARLRSVLVAAILLVFIANELPLGQSLLAEAVHLVPLVASRSLRREDQQHIVGKLLDLTSFAAAASLAAGKGPLEALKLLELGRNLTNGQLLDYRMDISELADRHPDLAKTFDALRTELDSPLQSAVEVPPIVEHQRLQQSAIKRRNNVARKFEATLKQIRQKAGFEDFLLSSTKEFFMSAACEGPIVILNLTRCRSDAILVTQTDITTIELPHLSYDSAKRFLLPERKLASAQLPSLANEEMKHLLAWLWNATVKPVLVELGIFRKAVPSTSPIHSLPRIWWIGTGLMATAPIHAAGTYRLGKPTKMSTLNYCIPSYIPTVKSLTYARSKCQFRHNGTQSILIVAMPTTPQASKLRGVRDEAINITNICNAQYKAHTLVQPSAQTVLQQLPTHEVVHFACHGLSTPNPADSHLLLLKSPENATDEGEVDKLYAKDIAARKLPMSRLAYLSACCSADNIAPELADEVTHLASSFQICGFRNVIGALWQAEDDACTQMTKEFYTLLMKCDDVALAYRDAVLKIRETKPEQPMYWAPFIHMGCDSSHRTLGLDNVVGGEGCS